MSKQKIVLQRDVYDALELSALIHGGIGSGCLSSTKTINENTDDEDYIETPSCIIGHGLFLDGFRFHESYHMPGQSPVLDELVRVFPAIAEDVEAQKRLLDDYRGSEGDTSGTICFIEHLNDTTVQAHATNAEETLTWKEWTKWMRIVRGDK